MRMALHRSIDDRKLHIRVCFWAEALLSFIAITVFLRGKGIAEAFYGYDEYLDNLHFKERCQLEEPAKSNHDLYACASFGLAHLIDEIWTRPNDYNGAIDDIVTHNFIHLVTDHLWDAFSIGISSKL